MRIKGDAVRRKGDEVRRDGKVAAKVTTETACVGNVLARWSSFRIRVPFFTLDARFLIIWPDYRIF